MEPLQKRSKNVRMAVRGIDRATAARRRLAYIRSTGLMPKDGYGSSGFPAANRNQIQYGGNFGAEHEAAHAMMTPDGSTIRQYQHRLNRDAKYRPARGEFGEDNADAHLDGLHDENVANIIENRIDRRAGVSPHDGVEISGKGMPKPVNGKPTVQVRPLGRGFATSDDLDTPDEWISDSPTAHRSALYAVPSADLQEAATHHIARFDNGAKFNSRGRIDRTPTLDSKINAGATGVNSLKALRARALGKSEGSTGLEDLQKRSKNVREQTRGITRPQAFARRNQYARSLGLDPVVNDEAIGVPAVGDDNKLVNSRSFPVEHELGHAVTAPLDQRRTIFQRDLDRLDEPHRTAAGAHAENVATQAEYGIDRRAGVGIPSRLRDFKSARGREHGRYVLPPSDAAYAYNQHAQTPSGLVAKPALRAEASGHLSRFDNGAKFDDKGVVRAPSGIHAAVNSGGGLAALRARAAARKTPAGGSV